MGAPGFHPWTRRLAAAGGVLLAVLLPAAGRAQAVRGRLLESGAERPIVRGVVRLMTLDSSEVARAVTDTAGAFEMQAPRPGEYFLAASALGYERSTTDPIVVRPAGLRVRLLVEPTPIGLDPVVATATPRAYDPNQEFHDRMRRRTSGRFITREQIERGRPVVTTDVLRGVPGLKVKLLKGNLVIEASHPLSLRDVWLEEGCYPVLYLDGTSVEKTAINAVQPRDIEGIEVYADGAAIPAEFNSSMGSACGVIVIWTRHGS
ncbi:MAG: carboxypeptidase regulatory-like domain-containing protein [Gemmatimonadetes bacterium]|nr:carboxypeptidase regulatory-like domain-containing protein [Gemmatimonadota bacterium]